MLADTLSGLLQPGPTALNVHPAAQQAAGLLISLHTLLLSMGGDSSVDASLVARWVAVSIIWVIVSARWFVCNKQVCQMCCSVCVYAVVSVAVGVCYVGLHAGLIHPVITHSGREKNRGRAGDTSSKVAQRQHGRDEGAEGGI